MREIVERLHERRQIELAKSILESKGYKVEKLDEADGGSDSLETLEKELKAKSEQKRKLEKDLQVYREKCWSVMRAYLSKEVLPYIKDQKCELSDYNIDISVKDEEEYNAVIEQVEAALSRRGWSFKPETPGDRYTRAEKGEAALEIYYHEYSRTAIIDLSLDSREYKEAGDLLSKANKEYSELTREINDLVRKIHYASSASRSASSKLSWEKRSVSYSDVPEYEAEVGDYTIVIDDGSAEYGAVNYTIFDENDDEVYVSKEFKTLQAAKSHAAKYIKKLLSDD